MNELERVRQARMLWKHDRKTYWENHNNPGGYENLVKKIQAERVKFLNEKGITRHATFQNDLACVVTIRTRR